MKRNLSIWRIIVLTVVVEAFMVALAFTWVAIYSYLIQPGGDVEFYQAYAKVASPIVSLVAGPIVFGLLGFGLAARRGQTGAREAWWILGLYLVLDILVVFLFAEDLRYNLLMWAPNAVTKALGVWAGVQFVHTRTLAHL